jgi:hypothetical protein
MTMDLDSDSYARIIDNLHDWLYFVDTNSSRSRPDIKSDLKLTFTLLESNR